MPCRSLRSRKRCFGNSPPIANPESYVASASVIQSRGPRISADIDIFHDREQAIAGAAAMDAATLVAAGFTVDWTRREPGLHVATVQRGGETTRLEWARDSDFRYFPTVADPDFGFRLHVFDIATNKVLAAAGRREPRDVIDLLFIHDRYIELGAVVWAAVAKDPGFSPESLLREIGRNARYRADDYVDLAMSEPVDAAEVARRLRDVLDEAERFVAAMPVGQEGRAFLRGGRPVQPDPEDLGDVVPHDAQRRGHWPSSPEIGGASLHADLD